MALHQATRFGHEARDQYRETVLYRTTDMDLIGIHFMGMHLAACVS